MRQNIFESSNKLIFDVYMLISTRFGCGDSDKSFAKGAVGSFFRGLGPMPQFFSPFFLPLGYAMLVAGQFKVRRQRFSAYTLFSY